MVRNCNENNEDPGGGELVFSQDGLKNVSIGDVESFNPVRVEKDLGYLNRVGADGDAAHGLDRSLGVGVGKIQGLLKVLRPSPEVHLIHATFAFRLGVHGDLGGV